MSIRSTKNVLLKKIRQVFGPGLITGASDDDPSGIATYSQAGTLFGLNTLWTAVFTFPLMAALQEMCARIGLVTKKGLIGTIKAFYPKWLVVCIVLVSFTAIVLNIGADLAGMGAVANMLIPSIPSSVFSTCIGLFLSYYIIVLPYAKIAFYLKWFCLSLLCYIIVPFLTKQDWHQVLKSTFVPHIIWNKQYLLIVIGILGTTISPYLFFWQTSMEVEEMEEKKLIVDKKIIHEMQTDVKTGIFFSNLVFFFIILSTGTVLHSSGIKEIQTVDQAALALKPLAGKLTYLLFAVGVLGTGMLAIPVLAGSVSYMVSEAFSWKEGLNKKFGEAKGFYFIMILSILIAMSINFTGVSPVKALVVTAIIYGLTAPLIIFVILLVSNNKKIMGDYTNGRWSNILGATSLLLMIAAGIMLLIIS
jgi:NRAMP (natural resistance-associated macrophage protein)-like metal ion transporter